MTREPSQWLIDAYTAVHQAAAVALRDQLISARRQHGQADEDPADAATELTRHDQNHGHYQDGTP